MEIDSKLLSPGRGMALSLKVKTVPLPFQPIILIKILKNDHISINLVFVHIRES